MPELPEVETIRRQLDEALSGKIVDRIEVLREKSFQGDPRVIQGKKIVSVKRKSKVLEIIFDESKVMVIIHLKMTGQLIFLDGDKRISGGHPTPDWVNQLPSRHTRVICYMKDGSKLFFNDMRVFGWIKIVDREKYENELKNTVPDVIDKNFTVNYLISVLEKSSKPIKLVIMDQEKIGGMGNIYANDALFKAKISPTRKADSLNKTETEALYEAMKEVIDLGIKYGGASASNYVQLTGLGGTYQNHFLVYKKEGEKCPRCAHTIRKMKIGGRGTFYCPNCQK